MSVRKLKPTTPGQRFRVVNNYDAITTDKPEKSLLVPLKKTGGRNNQGKMTMRYIGGGHKKKYRIIDFKRNKFGVEATVVSIEYDPNRTAFIALVQYTDGEKRYIIAPAGLKVGQVIVSGENVAPEIGNAMPLSQIPLGTVINSIELRPGQGANIARSAGTFAQLMAKEGKYATVKMPSGETRMILLTCLATIGAVSNSDHQLVLSGKAGRSRWLGRRPRTRAVVMNPVDHPMGGGEGRASGGHPRSRKGIPAKGYRTRSKTKASNKYIVEYQLPGGMLSNLLSQLKVQEAEDKYEDVLREIPHVRKDLGYPPLVTPMSQMVGAQAVLNILTGRKYQMIPKEIRDYVKGMYGKSPVPIIDETRKLIIGDDEVFNGRPADLLGAEYENMKNEIGDLAKCDEDILTYACFPQVARDYLERKYSEKEVEIQDINGFF